MLKGVWFRAFGKRYFDFPLINCLSFCLFSSFNGSPICWKESWQDNGVIWQTLAIFLFNSASVIDILFYSKNVFVVVFVVLSYKTRCRLVFGHIYNHIMYCYVTLIYSLRKRTSYYIFPNMRRTLHGTNLLTHCVKQTFKKRSHIFYSMTFFAELSHNILPPNKWINNLETSYFVLIFQ